MFLGALGSGTTRENEVVRNMKMGKRFDTFRFGRGRRDERGVEVMSPPGEGAPESSEVKRPETLEPRDREGRAS